MEIPIEVTETKLINVKKMVLDLKVSDMFVASFRDENDKWICDYDGYVPDFMPGDHYGDYVILEIDMDTGQILNWNKPDPDKLEKFISENL